MPLVHNIDDGIILNKSVLTFGNFDGFHLGHQKIINKVLEISKLNNISSVLVTFTPHTTNVINPKNKIKIMTPFNIKINLCEKFNLDILCKIKFDKRYSKYKADIFMDKIIKKYNPSYVILGYDNKFGYNRTGDYDYLANNSLYKHIIFIKVSPFNLNNVIIKSSVVRKLINTGQIDTANKYIKRLYMIQGVVVKGQSIGRSIGYPTANIKISNKEQLVPMNGVYSVNLKIGKLKKKGICNIGTKPTIKNNNKISIEVHLINEQIDLYNKQVDVEFKYFIRKEKKFYNYKDLSNQIKLDIEKLKSEEN